MPLIVISFKSNILQTILMDIDVSYLSSFLVSLGKVEPNWSRFGLWDGQDTTILRTC